MHVRSIGAGLLLLLASASVPAVAAERPAQADAAARHVKTGDTLRIRLQGGDWVELKDVVSEDLQVNPHRYEYRAFLATLKQHLVHSTEYEGESYLLIDDRNGRRTTIAGVPVISPDGKRFACRALNMIIGFAYLEVWSIEAGAFRREAKLDLTGPGISGAPEWISADGIRVPQKDIVENKALPPETARLSAKGWAFTH